MLNCMPTIDVFSANCTGKISTRPSAWLFALVSGICSLAVVSNDVSNSRISFAHQALTQNRKAQCQIHKSSPKSLTTNRIRPLKFLRAAGYDLGCVLRPPLRCRMMHLRLHSQFSQNEKSWWNKMLLAWSWALPRASFPGHLVTWSLIVSVYPTKTISRTA